MAQSLNESESIVLNRPDNELLTYSKERLERVLDHAPSDSVVRIFFDLASNETKVILTLYSQNLIYGVTEIAKTPYMAIEKVLNSLRIRLWEWRTTRFDQPKPQ